MLRGAHGQLKILGQPDARICGPAIPLFHTDGQACHPRPSSFHTHQKMASFCRDISCCHIHTNGRIGGGRREGAARNIRVYRERGIPLPPNDVTDNPSPLPSINQGQHHEARQSVEASSVKYGGCKFSYLAAKCSEHSKRKQAYSPHVVIVAPPRPIKRPSPSALMCPSIHAGENGTEGFAWLRRNIR